MSEQRKKDHIDLTFKSRPTEQVQMDKFYYEPLFAAHPCPETQDLLQDFMGHEFKLPLWVSSMTGGTEKAKVINKNLARACGEFGLGMGLGSCRSLIDSDERFDDFNVKPLMGSAPLFTNFGVAQLEQLIDQGRLNRVEEISQALKSDGMIIHVNPLQEWAQPEGDSYKRAAIETIREVVEQLELAVIVKEVGQGFGPKSLKALTELPLAAIELAGYGGTNFTLLEHTRKSDQTSVEASSQLAFVGHRIGQMMTFINELDPTKMKCQNFILSGGITGVISGDLYLRQLKFNGVIGMASQFLKYSLGEYQEVKTYIQRIKSELLMARAFIKGE